MILRRAQSLFALLSSAPVAKPASSVLPQGRSSAPKPVSVLQRRVV